MINYESLNSARRACVCEVYHSSRGPTFTPGQHRDNSGPASQTLARNCYGAGCARSGTSGARRTRCWVGGGRGGRPAPGLPLPQCVSETHCGHVQWHDRCLSVSVTDDGRDDTASNFRFFFVHTFRDTYFTRGPSPRGRVVESQAWYKV